MRWSVLGMCGAVLAGCGGLACDKGTHEVDGICVLNIKDADSITELCRDAPLDTLVVPVSFPAVSDECPWGDKDNADPWEGHLAARVEQSVEVELPAGAVFCDLTMDFSGGDVDEPKLTYTDHFLLVLDGWPIAASHEDLVGYLDEDDDDLPVYDWAEMAERFQPYEVAPWCLGIEQGAWCELPPSDTPGRVSVVFPRPVLSTLAFNLRGTASVPLRLVVTGDQDAGDCQHERVRFDLVMPWIPVEEI